MVCRPGARRHLSLAGKFLSGRAAHWGPPPKGKRCWEEGEPERPRQTRENLEDRTTLAYKYQCLRSACLVKKTAIPVERAFGDANLARLAKPILRDFSPEGFLKNSNSVTISVTGHSDDPSRIPTFGAWTGRTGLTQLDTTATGVI